MPAWSNDNLRSLAAHVSSPLFLAHVRAATGTPVQETNCHPFRHQNWLFVHNGSIAGYHDLRRELVNAIDAEFFNSMYGTTDSETMFGLALSFGLQDDAIGALERMAGFVEDLGHMHGIDHPLQMTLGVSDGDRLYAVRYSSIGQSRTLFSSAEAEALRLLHPENPALQELSHEDRAVVSEPLTDLPGLWSEVPEATALIVQDGPDEQRPFRPASRRLTTDHPFWTMSAHPARAEDRGMDTRPNLGDAALAVASTAVDVARLPLGLARRLPGMGRLAAEGALIRLRLRSDLEGRVETLLAAPEVERALDRVIAGTLPDAIVRSLVEHRVVERLAAELATEIEVDVVVGAVLEHETTQRLVTAIISSPGLDPLLVQATDRVLNGPELQRVVEHVAASPEVRAALQQQSTTLATEMATGLRSRAENLDDVAERTVRGWLRRPPHPA